MLLDAEDAHSDVWLRVAEHLQASCWRVGSATHCLCEWREPDDGRADVDGRCDTGDERLDSEELGRVRYRRAGRRGVWRWPKSDPVAREGLRSGAGSDLLDRPEDHDGER